MGGHQETERLPLQFLPPQQPPSPQLLLAMAGTLVVPKDEIGVAGGHGRIVMDIPISSIFFFNKPVWAFLITAYIGSQNIEFN